VKNWCLIIVVLVAISACVDDPDCLRSGDPALVISFKRLSDGKADTVVILNVTAENADSVFYKTSPDELDTLNGSALLRVNPFATETLFTFLFETEEKILRVGYKNEIRFISEACGSDYVQYDLQILETQFDSVRVVNDVLTTNRTPNIEIYN
jgi:hypothetical protein